MPARPPKSDLHYRPTKFLPNFPPISIPFSKEKQPILNKLGAFYNNLPNTPNLCNFGSFASDENPPIAIPNFAKKRPKRQAHIRIPCQCEKPPVPNYHTFIEFLPSSLKFMTFNPRFRQPWLERNNFSSQQSPRICPISKEM